MNKIIVFFVLIFVFSSCYKESVFYPETIDSFQKISFHISDTQYRNILKARDIKWDLYPVPKMNIENTEISLSNFGLRGVSTLDFDRKSYAVNTQTGFSYIIDNKLVSIDRFKLLSMVYDYTYIEHFIGTEFMRIGSLWPLSSFYTQVEINSINQGLYYFVESPTNYGFYRNNFDVLIRRHYTQKISSIEYSSRYNKENYAEAQFHNIYESIYELTGEELFVELQKYLDLDSYFSFMAINYLLMNGDYTDELFFYSSIQGDKLMPFKVMAWDLDDLFVSKPHEVGRSWSVGTGFSKRVYASKAEVDFVIQDKLIFSIEDDLDYIICTDDFLYQKYCVVFSQIISQFEDPIIDDLFKNLSDVVNFHYLTDAVIEQSQHDIETTSNVKLQLNLSEKKNLLKERITYSKSILYAK